MNNTITIDLDKLTEDQLSLLQQLLDQGVAPETSYESVLDVLEESDNIIPDLQKLAETLSEEELTEQLQQAEQFYNKKFDNLMDQADEVEEMLDYLIDFTKIFYKNKPAYKFDFSDIQKTLEKLLK